MHSFIFEIRTKNFQPEEWANDTQIADSDYRIDGADYWGKLNDAERNLAIYNFFTQWFPDDSFDIVSNEPCKTAVVRFKGDIKALCEKWIDEVKEAAAALNWDNASELGLYYVRKACDRPLNISSKFYMDDWCGCTSEVGEFLEYLRYLVRNDGERPLLYIGQVFDYHY